jgi:anion-transporting  ArsA/GET3 family ATPase
VRWRRDAIVCELGAQGSVPDAFGLPSRSIDPDAALREWIARNVGRPAAAVLSHSDAFELLIAAAPGARELVTIGKAWDLARPERSAGRLVVVDGPSTGHAIGLLQAPGTFSHLGRLGPVGRQAGRVRDFIADPRRCAIVLVCTPSELPVTETLELASAIEAVTGRGPDALVANMVLPSRFSRREMAHVERALGASADASLRTAARAARSAWRRAREQAEQLSRLREHLVAPVVELPFLFVPALGPEELGRLAVPLVAALG